MGRSFIAKGWLVSAAVWLIASLLLAAPALAEVPLENPDTARPSFSGIALFMYYSESLDFVLDKSPAEVEARLEKMPFANIPASLDAATQQFTSFTDNVAGQVVYVDEGVARLQILFAQSRFQEVKALSTDLIEVIDQANSGLTQMEQAMEMHGQVFEVDAAPAGSDLKASYDEVMEKIERIRQMLAIYLDIIHGSSDGSPDGSPSDPGRMPQATVLTLEIEPLAAFVGDEISFRGALRTDSGEPLVGRMVDILLTGSQEASATTEADGVFSGSLRVPYWYTPYIGVQALYYPRGGDVGHYVASLSPEVALEVLFYQATMNIRVYGDGHPGLDAWFFGRFDYGEWLILSEREVEIYLDNDLVATLQARPHVHYGVRIPLDLELGEHTITISARGVGRYAPVVATAGLTVTMMTPIVNLSTPGVVVMPWGAHLAGDVFCEGVPVSGASVKAGLRNARDEAVSSDVGTFETDLKAGWGLDLFGSGQFRVDVRPQEPWMEPVVVTRSVFLINAVNCFGLLAVLIVLGVYVPRRLKGRLSIWPSGLEVPRPRPVEPAAVFSAKAAIPDEVEEAPAAPAGKVRDRILYWYLLILKTVARITRLSPKPNQTLREFCRETGPALGPLSRRFVEITNTVERVLYSSHEASEEDEERTRSLSQNLGKGPGL